MKLMHDSPMESTHEGPHRFKERMRELFYWPTLAKDTELWAATCDVCQKIKVNRRGASGSLKPAHIPA